MAEYELDFEFQSRFEEEESIIQERILQFESLEEYRKEPGDFVYDIVIPIAPLVQQLQAYMDEALRQAFVMYAEGEYLDYKVEAANISRSGASEAKGQLLVQAAAGVIIPTDQELSTIIVDQDGNPITATVDEEVAFSTAGVLPINITTTGTGEIMNVPPGSSWIFSPPIAGVEAITQPERLRGGTDEETNESVRAKWIEKKHKPIRSGNKQSYVSWALEVPGVGKAKAIPLWAGRGTVKVIITDTAGLPAVPSLVAAVQAEIDPDQDGMGEGKAPVGAVVTVESAANLAVNVSADVVLTSGSTLEEATESLRMDLDNYLDGLASKIMDSAQKDAVVIVYNKIHGLLAMNPIIEDFSGLTVNSGTANITLNANEIPTSGTITLI